MCVVIWLMKTGSTAQAAWLWVTANASSRRRRVIFHCSAAALRSSVRRLFPSRAPELRQHVPGAPPAGENYEDEAETIEIGLIALGQAGKDLLVHPAYQGLLLACSGQGGAVLLLEGFGFADPGVSVECLQPVRLDHPGPVLLGLASISAAPEYGLPSTIRSIQRDAVQQRCMRSAASTRPRPLKVSISIDDILAESGDYGKV